MLALPEEMLAAILPRKKTHLLEQQCSNNKYQKTQRVQAQCSQLKDCTADCLVTYTSFAYDQIWVPPTVSVSFQRSNLYLQQGLSFLRATANTQEMKGMEVQTRAVKEIP